MRALWTALSLATQVASGNINVSNDPDLEFETDIAADPTNPKHLVGAANGQRPGVIWVYESTDGGRTWSKTHLSNAESYYLSWDPGVAFDARGTALVTFISVSDQMQFHPFVSRKGPGETSWSVPVKVSTLPSDKPFVAVDRSTDGPCAGNVYVAWTGWELVWFQGPYLLLFSRSVNGGRSFEAPVQLNDQGKIVIGASPAVGPDGKVYVAWPDYEQGRLVVDHSTDCGKTWGSDRAVHSWSTTIKGDEVIQLPALPNRGVRVMPHLAVDSSSGAHRGRLYAVFPDRADDGTLEVLLRYSDDGAKTWSEPRRVDDASVASDQFHPRVSVDRAGRVQVVFYDTRHDPRRTLLDVYWATSENGGESFRPNVRVTTVSSDHTKSGASQKNVGEYLGLAVASDAVFPLWTDRRADTEELYVARLELPVSDDGAVTAPLQLATDSLPSGRPGEDYAFSLTGTGGALPYHWEASGLPTGLWLDEATGALSGRPGHRSARSWTTTVTLRDSASATVSREYELTIDGSGVALGRCGCAAGAPGAALAMLALCGYFALARPFRRRAQAAQASPRDSGAVCRAPGAAARACPLGAGGRRGTLVLRRGRATLAGGGGPR